MIARLEADDGAQRFDVVAELRRRLERLDEDQPIGVWPETPRQRRRSNRNQPRAAVRHPPTVAVTHPASLQSVGRSSLARTPPVFAFAALGSAPLLHRYDSRLVTQRALDEPSHPRSHLG